VIVVVDDLVGFFAVDARLPAVVFEIAGNGVDGVGIFEEVDAAVAVAVLAVGQDIAGHELGDAQGASVGAFDADSPTGTPGVALR